MHSLCFLVLLLSCGGAASDSQETLQFGNFTLIENPEEFPEGLPELFRYPRATMSLIGMYDAGNFLTAQEGVVLFETTDTRDAVESYYTGAFRKRGWKVIQSVNKPGERLIMAESPFQKLVTVILRGNTIKLYFKHMSAI